MEIFTEGQWGVVGIEGWGEKEAGIACKQLGFGDVQVRYKLCWIQLSLTMD